MTTWFPCGRGKTLFILGSLPLYRLIIYIDRRILWCTHFLLSLLYRTKHRFYLAQYLFLMKTTHSYPVPDKKIPLSLHFCLHNIEPNTDFIWPNIYFSWKPPTHILSQTKKLLRLWYSKFNFHLQYTEPNTDFIWPRIYFSWKPPTHILSQNKKILTWWYPQVLFLSSEPNTDFIWPNIYFSWKVPTHAKCISCPRIRIMYKIFIYHYCYKISITSQVEKFLLLW